MAGRGEVRNEAIHDVADCELKVLIPGGSKNSRRSVAFAVQLSPLTN